MLFGHFDNSVPKILHGFLMLKRLRIEVNYSETPSPFPCSSHNSRKQANLQIEMLYSRAFCAVLCSILAVASARLPSFKEYVAKFQKVTGSWHCQQFQLSLYSPCFLIRLSGCIAECVLTILLDYFVLYRRITSQAPPNGESMKPSTCERPRRLPNTTACLTSSRFVCFRVSGIQPHM